MSNGKLNAYLAMAALFAAGVPSNTGGTRERDIDFSKKSAPPPKGSKEYFFDKDGEFSTVKMLRSDVVFKCYAINDANAKRKFEKHFKDK